MKICDKSFLIEQVSQVSDLVMDPRIEAAIIGAISALSGVIVGGAIQGYLKEKEINGT